MTIAACFVSPEGVVLGADSTTTNFVPHPSKPTGETHHFNYGQKIFEVGEQSSIGIATWGVGSFVGTSYRTLIASLGDQLKGSAPKSMTEVSSIWSDIYWSEYCKVFESQRERLADLLGKGDNCTEDELNERAWLTTNLIVGFCVGGHTEARRPEAFELRFSPEMSVPERPKPIPLGVPRFWGWSNLLERLNYGFDDSLFDAIITSGKWTGTQQDLIQIALDNRLMSFVDLPLRDAIDWVYSSIYTTIKAIKFSHFSPVCGGPIELAVITTDRRFRWVCHKTLDAAVD